MHDTPVTLIGIVLTGAAVGAEHTHAPLALDTAQSGSQAGGTGCWTALPPPT